MNRTLKLAALLIGAPLLLTGCLSDYPQFQAVDQTKLCVASTDEEAMQCPEGELFMARLLQPNPEIRAFNALNTAALYCDTNHPIFENQAGVMCVMTHDRFELLTGANPDAQGMESTQQDLPQAATQPEAAAESSHNDQAQEAQQQ
ncbi:MAG: hypothetical protein ACTH3D_05380 [Halomonas sp.]|uniref:hypothetical protein n=1 Tax=Halomonas sp. TaxID=1486246 RepID=UPI003F913537